MRLKHHLLTMLAVAAVVAVAVVVISRTLDANRTQAADPLFALAIDCDPTTGAVDAACTVPDAVTAFGVSVVLSNNSGAAVNVAAFNYTVRTDQLAIIPVAPPSCTLPKLNCNPDFNEGLGGSGWSCDPVLPDLNLAPAIVDSLASCLNLVDAPTLLSPASVKLGTVSYDVAAGGSALLSLREINIYDDTVTEIMSCNPILLTPGICNDAVVHMVQNATPTPTGTPIPPTATPIPQDTPSVTPTGAVTDLVGLNFGVCITAAIVIEQVPATTAAVSCFGGLRQRDMQQYVACLRGLSDGFTVDCLDPYPQSVLTVIAADFATIDVDANSVQQGQSFLVMAFVDGDYPVLFETDRGTFSGSGVDQPTAFCGVFGAPSATLFDPDCDANPGTEPDGVVTAKLSIRPTDARGPGQVTVTQNGISKTIDFTITGGATTIEIQSLDGRTQLETGATLRTRQDTTPDPDACDRIVSGPGFPSASLKKTNLFIRALDSDGAPVSGAAIDWVKAGATQQPFGSLGFGGQGQLPQGGVSSAPLPIWDHGVAGLGGVQTICGGDTPGVLDIAAKLSPFFSPIAGSYFLTYSIPVVDPLGPPVLLPGVEGGNVIALNSGVCNDLFRQAANGNCTALSVQARLQFFVHCLRTDECNSFTPPPLFQIQP